MGARDADASRCFPVNFYVLLRGPLSHLVPIGRSVNEDGFGILSIKPGLAPHIRFTIMEHPTAMCAKASHREKGLPLERGTSQNTPLMPWKRVIGETSLLGGPGPRCCRVCILGSESSDGQVNRLH